MAVPSLKLDSRDPQSSEATWKLLGSWTEAECRTSASSASSPRSWDTSRRWRLYLTDTSRASPEDSAWTTSGLLQRSRFRCQATCSTREWDLERLVIHMEPVSTEQTSAFIQTPEFIFTSAAGSQQVFKHSSPKRLFPDLKRASKLWLWPTITNFFIQMLSRWWVTKATPSARRRSRVRRPGWGRCSPTVRPSSLRRSSSSPTTRRWRRAPRWRGARGWARRPWGWVPHSV